MRLAVLAQFIFLSALPAQSTPALKTFLEQHCVECHDAETKKGDLDLTTLPLNLNVPKVLAAWIKVHDRVQSGEMPPEKKPRPAAAESGPVLQSLAADLRKADASREMRDGRSRMRRLNRTEFENTLRDLLAMPALKLKDSLPEDGKSHGFDRLAGALDISFVHMESYLSAVDKALNAALCPLPEAPPVLKYRYSPWQPVHHKDTQCEGSVAQAVGSKTGIGLIGMKRDETFFADTGHHITDEEPKATAFGLFRHEDADYRCTMTKIQPYVTGWYKLRVSGYSFGWDGKQVVLTDRHGALSWGVYQKGEHHGTVDLPPNKAAVREVTAWLERGGGMNHPHDDFIRIIGASLENVRDYANGPNKGVVGPMWNVPGIAVEWVEIEGPFNEQWPPASHRALFGDLPVKVWTPELGIPQPTQQVWPRGNPRSEPIDPFGERGQKRPIVYVESKNPAADAGRLLRTFLRKAFRRPVLDAEIAEYTAKVKTHLDAGAAFEDAMRTAYREALTSPEFLFIREPAGKLDDHSLATRLSYFLWNTLPDDELSTLADQKKLSEPKVLLEQTRRLLADKRSERFVEDFLAQWLLLRDIAATQPDRKLYPEFMPWLQDAMLMEARAYFTNLLRNDLGIAKLVQSDFAYLNEPLARLYGIEGVRGWNMQRVALPKDSPRGGFLTMAAVMKTTANGTTTSPVKRGAFVMEKMLGIVPTPPPPDAGTVEPDTRGTTTIREQLEKHKRNASCAACHQKMDGYGFALESFDVMGGWREQYRAAGFTGDAKTRAVLHGRGIEYHPAAVVDCSGAMPDGRAFKDVNALRSILASQPDRLANAFASHLITYATGAEISFADRTRVEAMVAKAKASDYGVRTLLLEVIQSELFGMK
jgi:mono/diheme cytochrome c family protein